MDLDAVPNAFVNVYSTDGVNCDACYHPDYNFYEYSGCYYQCADAYEVNVTRHTCECVSGFSY